MELEELKAKMDRAWSDAIRVQDASNLSGVVHTFSEHISTLWEYANLTGKGTVWVNEHPICVLFADKINDLTRHTHDRVYDAYKEGMDHA